MSLNETEKDEDLNLKALDLLTSTIQTYVMSNSIHRRGIRDLEGQLQKLEELRNEIRKRQLKRMLKHSEDKAENGVQEGEDRVNEQRYEAQENTETNDIGMNNETVNADNMYQYQYHDFQPQEPQESEEGSDINLSEVLTIVLNFNNYTYKDLANVDKMLRDITVVYPGVHTLVGSPYKMNPSFVHENLTAIFHG